MGEVALRFPSLPVAKNLTVPVCAVSKAPFVLLINPWITDFAAYDLWAKPLGLLHLASLLRDGGCGVTLVDCLDRDDPFTLSHPEVIPGVHRDCGVGKYPKMVEEKPHVYSDFKRRWFRHGIHPASLVRKLQSLPRPDLVWVTSSMTYWYPGVQETIALVREVFPGVPVWLGGIYARLCPDHARQRSGADRIVMEDTGALPQLLESATGFATRNARCWAPLALWPSPALELLPSPLRYAPLLTSVGCPFRCPYCASHRLQERRERRSARTLYGEIRRAHELFGVVDFAFYDDALLLDAEETLRPALQSIVHQGLQVRFHTPNALHVRALTPDWCRLLHQSGFTTLRLGLETTHPRHQEAWGGKVRNDLFFAAVRNLHAAGFKPHQIGVYMLCGLPDQTTDEVAQTIRIVAEAGAHPYPCEFSPLPGTGLWEAARAVSPFDIAAEPLYHNNTFFACRRPDFALEDLWALKDLARQARHAVTAPPESRREGE